MKVQICLVHGGAGTIPQSREEGKLKGVQRAAYIGYKTLIETDNAIEAVEKAVNEMELDPYFNAGYGSVLTIDGKVEMDASIMCGRTLNFGAVSLVQDVLHPISLARLVMQKSKHKFLSEDGAIKFARQNGMRILHPPGQLVTDFTSNVIQNYVSEHNARNQRSEMVFEALGETGTVGAVAILNREDNLFKVLGLDENFASNWDLYLIIIISILLGMIIYSRRPPPEAPALHN